MSTPKQYFIIAVSVLVGSYIIGTMIGKDIKEKNAKFSESGLYEQKQVCKMYENIWVLKDQQ